MLADLTGVAPEPYLEVLRIHDADQRSGRVSI